MARSARTRVARRRRIAFAPGTLAAAVTSSGMIAQQVAGKAVRDALFLSSFKVHHLPHAMAAASVLSLVVVMCLPMVTTRISPRRFLPLLFAGSAVGPRLLERFSVLAARACTSARSRCISTCRPSRPSSSRRSGASSTSASTRTPPSAKSRGSRAAERSAVSSAAWRHGARRPWSAFRPPSSSSPRSMSSVWAPSSPSARRSSRSRRVSLAPDGRAADALGARALQEGAVPAEPRDPRRHGRGHLVAPRLRAWCASGREPRQRAQPARASSRSSACGVSVISLILGRSSSVASRWRR